MDRNIELLAPAGDWEAFIAAVENGADAVYLGGKLLNARQYAGNFDDDQLKEALSYAHIRDTKIYLAMNTIISDNEMAEGVKFAEKAYLMGIDGIIVQDIGFAALLRKILPDLPVHASTQMTIYNLDGVKALEKAGFKRVILARELSIEEIKYITERSNAEIEIFVHGALCISYSGQCLMSSMIGGRSGNRGKCAQPCRLVYELVDKGLDSKQTKKDLRFKQKGYILSPKDLCLVKDLKKAAESGVKALKIEGRMKSPEYVATVVRIYRKYLDKVIKALHDDGNKEIDIDEKDLKDLAQVFNRGGFSKGYFFGKTGRDMMSYEKPKNWGVFLGKVISFNSSSGKVKIKLEEDLSIGDGIEIWSNEEDSPGNIVTEIVLNGKNMSTAAKGSIVDIGTFKGRIFKGNAVYKTSDKTLNSAARESFREGNKKKIGINGTIHVENEKPVVFTVEDDRGNRISIDSGYIPEVAVTKPITNERLIQQLNKTGSTPYRFDKLNIILGDNLSVPISKINEIRRKALDKLSEKRAKPYSRALPEDAVTRGKDLEYFLEKSTGKAETADSNLKKPKLSVLFRNVVENIDYSGLNADRLYLPFKWFTNKDADKVIKQCRTERIEVFAWIPAVTRGNFERFLKKMAEVAIDKGVDGILAGNIGTIEYFSKYRGLTIAGDFSLNVFNSFSVNEIKRLGLSAITLSVELTLKQIEKLKNISGISKEVIVYGRIPLMTSEYCPVGSLLGKFGAGSKCSGGCESGIYSLKDRKGKRFPVLCDKMDCRSIIFNSDTHFLADSMDAIIDSGVDIVRLDFIDEDPSEISETISLYREAIERGESALGEHAGHIDRIKSRGFTKGHYFRGV
ncbi:MAG TPA: U32 family peptidase [Clostridiaceae bacterium]|nr:U32 family peptidase [Clostridiaceae bacterium]